MPEFLMVIPEGWTEVTDPAQYTGEDSWRQFLPSDVSEVLKQAGVLAADDSEMVEDFRVFVDGNALRLWVKVVPHIVG